MQKWDSDYIYPLLSHDYNKDLAGPDVTFQLFLEFNQKACANFSKAFGKWVIKVMEAREGCLNVDGRKPIITWQKGPRSVLIIPPPILTGGQLEHLKTKHDIICEFFRMHYCKSNHHSSSNFK